MIQTFPLFSFMVQTACQIQSLFIQLHKHDKLIQIPIRNTYLTQTFQFVFPAHDCPCDLDRPAEAFYGFLGLSSVPVIFPFIIKTIDVHDLPAFFLIVRMDQFICKIKSFVVIFGRCFYMSKIPFNSPKAHKAFQNVVYVIG